MTVLPAESPASVGAAAAALRDDRVVAFPTDTAYALGADPGSPAALAAIYGMKGRPGELPLILLAARAEDLSDWAVFSDRARAIAARHWPGPLTLILPAGPRTPPGIRAADGSIGVRVPAHPAALTLLRLAGPLATTSANRSGDPSSRSAGEVVAAFASGSAPALLLDGGPTRHAADSTILSLLGAPRILRRGALAPDQLTCD